MKKLLIGLVAIVLLEISIFIVVGKNIGVLNTLFFILLTSVIGIWIAKKQGIQSVQNMRNSMAEGNPPGPVMVDTFLIFVGGILLILPGFLTDLFGFLLVFPSTRNLFKPAIYHWLRKKMNNGQIFIIHK